MVRGFGPGTITPTYTIVQTPVLLATDNWINVTALRSLSYAENSTLSISGVSKVYGLTNPTQIRPSPPSRKSGRTSTVSKATTSYSPDPQCLSEEKLLPSQTLPTRVPPITSI